MSNVFAVTVFVFGLVVTLASSVVLAHRIDQLGNRLRCSEGLLGLLTALAANAPEVTSAVTALASGRHDVGLGVVVGSNLFNLAALLGLSAVLAGAVPVGRPGLWFGGGVALAVVLVVTAEVAGLIPNWAAGVGLALVMVPYVVLSALPPGAVERVPLPRPISGFLAAALTDARLDSRKPETPRRMAFVDGLDLVPTLVAVVAGSVVMVRMALVLGGRWGVPSTVIGTLVLASLTGLPNMIAAVRLAIRHRGSAVVSETLNSNSLNLIAGVFAPALLLGLVPLSGASRLALGWLIGMTVLALALASARGGLRRAGGFVIIALYAAFIVLTLVWR
jgi:cation:H+ antiporter